MEDIARFANPKDLPESFSRNQWKKHDRISRHPLTRLWHFKSFRERSRLAACFIKLVLHHKGIPKTGALNPSALQYSAQEIGSVKFGVQQLSVAEICAQHHGLL